MKSPLENLKPKGEALEERISAQALTADLKTAIVAALTGRESRRWTVGELFDRLNNLGVRCSKPAVAGALGELELEFALCPFLPWNLVEQGTEWTLTTKTELLELLSGVRKLPGVTANTLLTEEAKAVLLVVIGYRKKGGVSRTRIREILGLEAAPYLENLCKKDSPTRRLARNSTGDCLPRRRSWPWACAPTPISPNSRSSNATLIPRSLLETIMKGKRTWSPS